MTVPSPTTGKIYPKKLLCEVLAVPRSNFYASLAPPPRVPGHKRGPKTAWSNEELLAAIRTDLAASPFVGEGHRKVWARAGKRGFRVGRKRVLRLMRRHRLLAPGRRCHAHGDQAHRSRIITAAPDRMWGTDGKRFLTLEEGWCWAFLAVDHFDDEVVGWHACKRGNRFAALEPLRQGVWARFGGVGEGVARGLTLRLGNGPQYLAQDLRDELEFLGIEPSPTFVEEPEGNGIVERVIGLLKEQCLWGRRFVDLAEAREKIGALIARYNAQWLIELLGFRSPVEARVAQRAEVVVC